MNKFKRYIKSITRLEKAFLSRRTCGWCGNTLAWIVVIVISALVALSLSVVMENPPSDREVMNISIGKEIE